MRIAALLGLTVLLQVAAVPTADAGDGCSAPNSKTLRKNDRVRVYFVPFQEVTFACWKPTGRRFELVVDGPSSGVASLALRGRFLAVEESYVSRGSTDEELGVRVVDVRSQKARAAWDFHLYSFDRPEGESLAIRGKSLKRNGSFAFLVGPHTEDSSATSTHTVYSVGIGDHNGVRLLDRSSDIEPTSFRASRTSISWTRAGQLFASPFD
jgi:hypothetical protein